VEPKAPSQIDVHVGERIRQLRQQRGMSQPELAERLGIRYQQFQKYESGANRISAGRLYEIARIMGVGLPWFYVGLDLSGAPFPAATSRSGLAEDGEAFIHAPNPSGDRERLLAAYDSIEAADIRKAVADVVEAAAALSTEGDDGSKSD
jgi:transcriptional regulator with XRE-family HTH domain